MVKEFFDKINPTRKGGLDMEYLKELNPEQREAAVTTEGYIRVVAGAGSVSGVLSVVSAGSTVAGGLSPQAVIISKAISSRANRER